jgi:hypothetical protein
VLRHINCNINCKWSSMLQKLDPKSDGAARDWVAIYDECSRILYEEIDYRMEADYARDFAVLVMEYVPGVKINNAEAIDEMGLDRDRLARLAVESYLQQLLRHGWAPFDAPISLVATVLLLFLNISVSCSSTTCPVCSAVCAPREAKACNVRCECLFKY